MKTSNLKVILMGILLMTTATFSLMIDNTSGNVFAQGSNNPFIGCAHKVLVTLSGFPNQTPDSSIHVALSQVGPNSDSGEANTNIHGIGSGHVILDIVINPPQNGKPYSVIVSNIPGQTGESDNSISPIEHCPRGSSFAPIDIPGMELAA